jgi:hypothetical protein
VSLSGAREKARLANFKTVVKSIQSKAVEVCESGDIDYTDGTGSFGTFATEIDAANISGTTNQDCGPGSSVQFEAGIPSIGLATTCTATISETGVTSFLKDDGSGNLVDC